MKIKESILIAATLTGGAYAGNDIYQEERGREFVIAKDYRQRTQGNLPTAADGFKVIEGDEHSVTVELARSDFRAMAAPLGLIVEEVRWDYSVPQGGCGFNPPAPVEPNPPSQPTQVVDWGIEAVGSMEVIGQVDGSSTTVCVLDTGIDTDHPDLTFAEARDFTNSASGVEDLQSHGTHTAGTVSATNNGIGVVGASQARLIIGKVLNDYGSGSNAGIASGIHWCIDSGADIISMSLGGPSPSSALESALARAEQAGVWVFAAAGNDGSSQVGYPAGYVFPHLYSISALNRSGGLAYFSNYGKIEFACPGVDILSSIPGGRYDRYSGTSMATPICAGVAALYRSAGKELKVIDLGDSMLFGAGMPDARQVIE